MINGRRVFARSRPNRAVCSTPGIATRPAQRAPSDPEPRVPGDGEVHGRVPPGAAGPLSDDGAVYSIMYVLVYV